MDEKYDLIICGTGLSECILSGQLSKEGKKVLHIDRNKFYGGESASLNLTSMWKKFREDQIPNKQFGENRDWNIDLIPKYVIVNGNLVKILMKTKVSNYLEWHPIDATYVLQMREAGYITKGGPVICKVPGNDVEALNSDLMGMLEKRRCKNFFVFVQQYDPNDKKTHQGWTGNIDKDSFASLVKYFALAENTIDFIGHAVALYTTDEFLSLPCNVVLEKIRLYMNSVGIYGESPFLYPLYGLGGIPEGFSRMCAIHGGTFMLDTDIDKILFDEDGKVKGVQKGEQITECKTVICSPSYAINCGLQDRVKCVGKVVRVICIMDHPIPKTKDVPSIQIILPQRQTGRKSDIYISMMSNTHNVCKKGFYVCIISAMVETNSPEQELKQAFDIIGPTIEQFVNITDMYEPVNNKPTDGLYITKSMDQTSHFESETQDVLDLYENITGKPFDLVLLPEDQQE